MLSEIKRAAGNRFFRVTFIKRTTGELRNMVCRFGVTKHLTGGEQKYDAESKGLLTVFEPGKGYRSIPVDGIKEIQIDGVVYSGRI